MNDRFVDLLRHGEVAGGGRFRGTTDDALSETGRLQMRAILQGQGGWDALFTSPARRCADFAHELAAAQDLPPEVLPELGERDFGTWENRQATEIPLPELDAFWKDPVGFIPPEAEPLAAFQQRVLTGWDRVLGHTGTHVLTITHGGVIRIILAEVLGMPAEALLRIEVPPACHTRLRVPLGEGRPSLMWHRGPEPCGVPS